MYYNLSNLILTSASVLPWVLFAVTAVLAVASAIICWFLGVKWGKKKAEDNIEWVFEEDENDNDEKETPDFVDYKRDDKKLFVDALKLAVQCGSISISQLQRHFQLGYARAGGIVDKMEDLGYICANEGAKARRVLITKEQFEQKYGPLEID